MQGLHLWEKISPPISLSWFKKNPLFIEEPFFFQVTNLNKNSL